MTNTLKAQAAEVAALRGRVERLEEALRESRLLVTVLQDEISAVNASAFDMRREAEQAHEDGKVFLNIIQRARAALKDEFNTWENVTEILEEVLPHD